MNTYISLLRGINVSGQKKIKMEDLKNLYEKIGFQNVQTYIQSGNVIFASASEDTLELANLITKAIFEVYSFEVPVLILKPTELADVLAKNPFQDEENQRLYYIFLLTEPTQTQLEKLEFDKFLPDKFAVVGKTIYLSVVAYGNSKLSNNFFENVLKINATTRNHNTVLKLLELA